LNHLIPPERDIASDAQWLVEAGTNYPKEKIIVSYDNLAIEI